MVDSSLHRRETPRVSVNDLALFMVSSDTARLGIIRRAKHPQLPPIIRYRDVRPPLCHYLSDRLRSVNSLVTASSMLSQRSQDASDSALRQDDARHSIEVLHAIQAMANQLAAFDFHAAPQNQPTLSMAAVEISVRADLLVHGTARGREQIGAAILRMTQDDAETDAARAKRHDTVSYVETLARLHLESNIH